jgi:hypothetical protein
MCIQLAISTSYVVVLEFVNPVYRIFHTHTPPHPPHQEINSKRTTMPFCNTLTLTAPAFIQPTTQHVPRSRPVVHRLRPLHLPLSSCLLHHASNVGVPTQSSCHDLVGHRCCCYDLGVVLCVHYEEEWGGILQKDRDAGKGLV